MNELGYDDLMGDMDPDDLEDILSEEEGDMLEDYLFDEGDIDYEDDYYDEYEEGDFVGDELGDLELAMLDRLAREAGDMSLEQLAALADEQGGFFSDMFKKVKKFVKDPTKPLRQINRQIRNLPIIRDIPILGKKKKRRRPISKGGMSHLRKPIVKKLKRRLNPLQALKGPKSVEFWKSSKNGRVLDKPAYGNVPLATYQYALRQMATWPAAKKVEQATITALPTNINCLPAVDGDVIVTPSILITFGGVSLTTPAAGTYKLKFNGVLTNGVLFDPRPLTFEVKNITKPAKLLVTAYSVRDTLVQGSLFRLQKQFVEKFIAGTGGVPITWTPQDLGFEVEVQDGAINNLVKVEPIQTYDRLANVIAELDS